MPLIEVLPNSTSTSAPGWAYVPDTGYDPSKAAIQPSGARKRAARASGISGNATARQNNALLKRLADLDRDNHKDVQIPIPAKQKESAGRGSKGKTPGVRKILLAQKTFTNYLADEEAALASQDQQTQTSTPVIPHSSSSKQTRPLSQAKRSSISSSVEPVKGFSTKLESSADTQQIVPSTAIVGLDSNDAKLLQSYIPSAPSKALMEALTSAPPLSYNAARAASSSSGQPLRQFCEICGYRGRAKCTKCGARVCGLECMGTHEDGRCQKSYG